MNETIKKFGYPATLLREYDHWVVLLRPAQVTLGSLVLAAKSDATAIEALPPEAYAELQTVTAAIAQALSGTIQHQKINYLLFMMIDPHVHFHALPRYEGERTACGVTIADTAWPGVPDISQAHKLNDAERDALRDWLKPYFTQGQ
ncbi:MAG: HIT family protein [Sphingobium sp.]|uniref:HIT family protein n=1 Tax=Sphingobium sp. TaxID=1912891 RepID=UPI0029B62082|nr:HIT family protein [Sphingobium sp.]MDX3908651.1 HIT family protein [Sphingobium sp.]